MTALFASPPKIPATPAAAPPPPQLPNAAVGDAVQEQQQGQGANGVSSTVATSPQGVTSGGPRAGAALAAVMPANVASTIIGGAGAFNPTQQGGQATLLG